MAEQTIELRELTTGQTGLTAKIFPRGSLVDAVVSGLAVTELTYKKTHYRLMTTAAISGWHDVIVFDADLVAIGTWSVLLTNTTKVHYADDVGEAVWNNAERTLTQTAEQVNAVMTGPDLVIPRGDTWTHTLTGLGSLVGYDLIWLTIKKTTADPDSKALFQIEKTAGLIYLAQRTTVTPGDGVLTVNDINTGSLSFRLNGTSTICLWQGQFVYDVKARLSGDPITRTRGRADVVNNVTHAIS